MTLRLLPLQQSGVKVAKDLAVYEEKKGKELDI